MNRLITACIAAAVLAAPAFGADGPAKPQSGQAGLKMERSAGEEMPNVAAQKGSKTGAKMERSLGEEMKGMSAAKGMAPAKDMKGMTAAKGTSPAKNMDIIGEGGNKGSNQMKSNSPLK